MATLELTGPDVPKPIQIPPKFAELMWPELPIVLTEVIAEIRRTIPVYDQPRDSAYGQVMELGAQKLCSAFIEEVALPSHSLEERDATARALGHFEALEGRSLDSLNAAYRIAFHVAWRRTAVVAEREQIPSGLLALMVDKMISYMEEVTAQTTQGHRAGLERANKERQEERRQLLRLILQRPAASAQAVKELAARLDWVLPDEVTIVVAPPGSACTKTALDHDLLFSAEDELVLLVPGPMTPLREAMLAAALGTTGAAIGLTVPLADAADSLRWALRLLELVSEGVVRHEPFVLCAQHLMTIFLLADIALVEQLAQRQLAPLNQVTRRQRLRLIETLREWVAGRGTAVEIGARLQVHPQTVRYRIRQLDQYLGEALTDPDIRFSVEVALRATHLRAGNGGHGNSEPNSPELTSPTG